MEIRKTTFRDLSVGDSFVLVSDEHYDHFPYLRTEEITEKESDIVINSVSLVDGIFHAFEDNANVVLLRGAKVVF